MVAAGLQAAGLPSDWAPVVQTLADSIEGARHFRGSLVVVHGPPGIGKTRLINGALEAASVPSRRIRRTFLESRDAESPYRAVLSLARWAGRLDEIAPARDSGSLVLAPFLRALTPDGDGSGAVPHPGGSDTSEGLTSKEYGHLVADLEFYKRGVEAWGERSRFLHEVGWMILDAAARRHIVWIVEGAQHIDPHSLAVVRYLAGCLDENPLVIWFNVETGDEDVLPSVLAPLVTGTRARELAVPRLSREGVAEVLRRRYPGQSFSEPLVESLHRESRGFLLTVEQLASDPRVLRGTAPAVDGATDALSLSLGRLEELPARDRELIEQLAVVGEEVPLTVAVRLAGRPEMEVLASLKGLVAAGYFLEPEPGRYCFCLGALPGAIEARLPKERFRELHRAVAEALTASGTASEDRIFDLADHWRKAEVWQAAAETSLAAARFSCNSFAPEGGVLQADRALEAARQLPERRPILEGETLIEKGRALHDLGRIHEAVDTLREAIERIGADPAVWPHRARALFYLARALSALGRPQEAFEVVQEASRALARVDNPRAQLMLHQVIGVALMATDQNREAVEHFRPMLAIAQSLGDAREIAYAQKNLSAVLLAIDPHDVEGWQLVDAALEYHTRTNNFAGLAAGYLNRSLTKLALQDSTGALADLARSRQAGELAHAPLLIAAAALQETGILLDRGEVHRADTLLKVLAPWMSAMEEPWARVSYALLQGRVAEAQQRPTEAEHLYDEAICLAEPGGASSTLWECRLRRAALAKRTGAIEQARRLARDLPSADELRKVAPGLVDLRQSFDAGPG